MAGLSSLIHFLLAVLDLFAPFCTLAIWRHLNRRQFVLWQSFAIAGSIWLAGTYLFAHIVGYTIGNYLFTYIAVASLQLTGELPVNTQGFTYDHYVSYQQIMTRYWTVPPLIFVVLPTLLILLIQRMRHKDSSALTLKEQ